MQRICGLRPRIERTAVPLDTVFVKVFYSPARFIPIIRLLQALAIEPSFRSFFTPETTSALCSPYARKTTLKVNFQSFFLQMCIFCCTFARFFVRVRRCERGVREGTR